ncbi:MAG: T9SS type A sorting domain-containing protein, partial [Bacteroidota bacterium]
GQKHAPASTIGFYLSTDKHFDENDYFVGSKDVNALNPGKTATLTFEEDIPDTYPPAGRYYLGFVLDYDKKISEENEANNNDCYFDTKVVVPERGGSHGGNNSQCVCSNYSSSSFCDDFDSYNTGYLGTQSACWTTWSGVVGASGDGVVESSNGNQYLSIKAGGTPQDVVMMFGNRERGKYQVEFKMWLFGGHRGYFNVLHDFRENASYGEHAYEVFFTGNGTGYLRAEGRNHTFVYPTLQWFDIKQEFDLDNDKVSVYLNNILIASWKFSSTPNSNRDFMKRLAGMNYYPADAQNQFYIDDIKFNKVSSFTGNGVEGRSEEELPAIPMQEEKVLPSMDMAYYPNPASNHLIVEFNVEQTVDMIVELVNAMGQTVLRYEEDGVQSLRHEFDLSDQAAGMYYIRAWAGDQQMVRPVVVTK